MSMVKPLRQWKWGVLPRYNGFEHDERVRGWQLVRWFEDNGWLSPAATCCISGSSERVSRHSEDYSRLAPYPLCQSVHLALHRRFKHPDAWRRIVSRYSLTGEEWFARLSLVPIDLAGELRAKHGPEIADIFARAPIPEGVTIPRSQIYRRNIE
ncbi:hypothetical protein [Rhizobium sp. IBUN]|uniref:hypothetical protein n=1 Tax=Rhizobium sp. IBUN TaxID=1042326 RepID=UPI0012EC3CBB|nr:hypothetical protein [Rhizobium sp. IBUN]